MRYVCVLLTVLVLTAPRAVSAESPASDGQEFTAYLMAYFGPEEKLFYAYSRDARRHCAMNRYDTCCNFRVPG